MLDVARYLVRSTLPPVPSATVVYKGTQTTTTNETTTTWTGIDIGTPHPKRIVILAVYIGVGTSASATVNGISSYHRTQVTTHEFAIFAHQVPCGTTADIAVTAAASTRKAAAVYVAYPRNHMVLDDGTDTANSATDAVISNVKVQAGGFLIYAGGQNATLGTFTTTWTGPDAVTEDVDAQLESAASYTMGRIDTTVSSDQDDLTLAESVSGTKRLVCASWGPP